MHLPVGKGCEAIRSLDPDGSARLPCRPVGETQIANLSGAHDRIERVERLFERSEWILTMGNVHVDPIGAEPPQALIDRRARRRALHPPCKSRQCLYCRR